MFLAVAGIRLRLEGQYGPGPGFLAFWVGVALAAAERGLARPGLASPAPPRRPRSPSRAGPERVASIILALIAFAVLLTPLGFTLVHARAAPRPLLRLRPGARAREDRRGARRQRRHARTCSSATCESRCRTRRSRRSGRSDSRGSASARWLRLRPRRTRRVRRRLGHSGADVDRRDRRLGAPRQPRRRHGPPARQVRLSRARCGRSTGPPRPWPACRPFRRSPRCRRAPPRRAGRAGGGAARRRPGVRRRRASATASPTPAGSARPAGRAPSSSGRSSPCAGRPGSRSAARTASGSSTRRCPRPRRSRPRSSRWTRSGPAGISIVAQSGGIAHDARSRSSSRRASAAAT